MDLDNFWARVEQRQGEGWTLIGVGCMCGTYSRVGNPAYLPKRKCRECGNQLDQPGTWGHFSKKMDFESKGIS